MATAVAQIIAGSEDLYHGGIRPLHVAWLRVNDRPSWTLEPTGDYAAALGRGEIDPEEEAPARAREPVSWVPPEPELAALRDLLAETLIEAKLIVCLFRDSGIDDQLKVLERYRVQVEVLRTTYTRSWGGWSGASEDQPNITGSLADLPD